MRKMLNAALLCLAVQSAVADPIAEPSPNIARDLRELFFQSAREGRLDMLSEFINAKYDLNITDDRGYTALILAAYHGRQAAVSQLLDAGADPCTKDFRGNTALMGAIFKGELSIAHRLVAADCAPDQRNNAGQTAAMYAALFHRKDVLAALSAKGADLDVMDFMGNQVQSLERGEFQPLQPAR